MKNKTILILICLLPIISLAQNKILINPSVGYAWRTAKLPDGLSSEDKTYLNKLKSGINYDISAYYLFKPDLGLGLKFNQYNASASGNYTIVFDNTTQTGSINTKDNITFIGPSVYAGNYSSESKHKYLSALAIGYISYKSSSNGVEAKGGNIGISIDLGYQYQVSPKFSIGPQLGITAGTLKKFKIMGQTYDLPKDSYEALHRISLSVGANFRL